MLICILKCISCVSRTAGSCLLHEKTRKNNSRLPVGRVLPSLWRCCRPCRPGDARSRAPRLGVGAGGHDTGTSRDDSGRHSNERSGVQRSAERFLPVQAGRHKVSSHQWQLLEQPGAGRSSRPCYKTTLRRHKRRLAPHSALTSSGLCRLAADPRRCQARLHR